LVRQVIQAGTVTDMWVDRCRDDVPLHRVAAHGASQPVLLPINFGRYPGRRRYMCMLCTPTSLPMYRRPARQIQSTFLEEEKITGLLRCTACSTPTRIARNPWYRPPARTRIRGCTGPAREAACRASTSSGRVRRSGAAWAFPRSALRTVRTVPRGDVAAAVCPPVGPGQQRVGRSAKYLGISCPLRCAHRGRAVLGVHLPACPAPRSTP
jgi:hypothetical protein